VAAGARLAGPHLRTGLGIPLSGRSCSSTATSTAGSYHERHENDKDNRKEDGAFGHWGNLLIKE
jgi:hypothetical protein